MSCMAAAGQPSGHHVHALVVEAHPIDHRLVFDQTKKSWLGIARLRARRNRAHLDEAEALRQQGIRHLGILVESGGKADGIGKIAAPQRDHEGGIVAPRLRRHQSGLQNGDAESCARPRRETAEPTARQCDNNQTRDQSSAKETVDAVGAERQMMHRQHGSEGSGP